MHNQGRKPALKSEASPYPAAVSVDAFSAAVRRNAAPVASSARSSDAPTPYPAAVSVPPVGHAEFKELAAKIKRLKIDYIAEILGGVQSVENKFQWGFPNIGRVVFRGSKFEIQRPGAEPVQGYGNLDFAQIILGLPSLHKTASALATKMGDGIDDQFNFKPLPGDSKKQSDEEFARFKALANKVDLVQVRLVMEALGAEPNQDKDRNKWKLPGVGNISLKGQGWFNHNAEEGKRGAVSLIQHCLNLRWKEAIIWLAKEFGERVDSDDIKASLADLQVEEKKPFVKPERVDRNIEYVRRYLTRERALPKQLVDELISTGVVYADEYRRCVFFSEGIAEIRSSFDGDASFKGLAPGSTRDFGFLVNPDSSVPPEYAIGICESAIDSASYRTLKPGRAAVSGAGAGKAFPRKVARQAINMGLTIFACFDADEAGDKAAQALFNYLYIRELLVRRKGMDPDDVDELFENKTIDLGLKTVPKTDSDVSSVHDEPTDDLHAQNRLFFNSPEKPDFSGANGPKPCIVWKVKKTFDTPNGPVASGEHRTVVSEPGWTYIVKTLKVSRDRPVGEKDWNEILKKSQAPAPSKGRKP